MITFYMLKFITEQLFYTKLSRALKWNREIPFQMILTQLIYVQLLHDVNIVAFTLDYIEDIIYYNKSELNFEDESTLILNYKDKKIPIWSCFGRNLSEEDFRYINKGKPKIYSDCGL